MIVKKSIAIVLAGLVLGSYPVGAKADDIQPSSSSSSTSISSQVQSSSAESSTSSSKGQSDKNAESTKQPEISSSSNASKSESSDTKGQNDTPDSQVTIKNGWVTDNDQTFYYENNQKVIGEKYIAGYWYLFDKLADGAMVTGLQNLAGYGQNKTVYYNDNGQMLYGEQKINGSWYLFNKWNGGMVTGFQNLAGYGQNKTVYYNDNGQMLYGEQKINGSWYLFDKWNGAMQKTYQQVIAPTVNVAGWAGLCLKYVDDAFGISYSDGQRSYTARLSAQKAMNNQTMHYDNSFPKGVMVPVYWNLVNKEDGGNYGHIAIWDGDSGFYWESTNGSQTPNHLTWDQINQIFAGKRKVNGSYLNNNWKNVSFIGWSETSENTRIVKVK